MNSKVVLGLLAGACVAAGVVVAVLDRGSVSKTAGHLGGLDYESWNLPIPSVSVALVGVGVALGLYAVWKR